MTKEELEDRTLKFSNSLIKVLSKLPRDLINSRIISQVTSSGTSIGANYREANASESEKDFKHKMNLSFKEAKETKYWLDILLSKNLEFRDDLMLLRNEADELSRIFGKAVSTCRRNAELKNAK